jgi:hypothetical protein
MPSCYFPVVDTLSVLIYPGNYYTSSGFVEVSELTTIDLSTIAPPLVSGECRMAMIVFDSNCSGTYRVGTAITGWDNLSDATIPLPVPGDNTICAVKMFYGQTQFRKDGYNNDFVDLRWSGVANGSIVTVGPHASTHISTGSDPIDAAVAAGASGLMTGADKTKLDGLTSLRIKTVDGATNVTPVETIVVTNGTLTNDGSGQVTIDTGGGGGSLGLEPIDCTAQVDGTETHFTFTPACTAALALLNGAVMKPADVTLDGDGLGVVLGFAPEVGDNLIIIRASDPTASGGHTIQDAGTAMTARANLNLVGFTVEDDAVNAATKVTAITPEYVNLQINSAQLGTDSDGVIAIATTTPPGDCPSGTMQIYVGQSINIITEVPIMTSNVAPSGVAFASTSYVSNPAWKAFANSDGWITDGSALPQSVGYQFTSAKTIVKYSILGWITNTFPFRCPVTWKLQGSSNGTDYTDVHSVTGYVNWSLVLWQDFMCTDPGSYVYYRLYITANNGDSYAGVGGLKLFTNSSELGLYARTPSGIFLLSN